MADRIHATSEWLDKCARDLRAIEGAINTASGTLSSINLRRDEGGNLRASLSCGLKMTGGRYSGNNATDDIRQLQRAAAALATATSAFSGGASRAARLFEGAERRAEQLIRAASTGGEKANYSDVGPAGTMNVRTDWVMIVEVIRRVLEQLRILPYKGDGDNGGKTGGDVGDGGRDGAGGDAPASGGQDAGDDPRKWDYEDPGAQRQAENDAVMHERIRKVFEEEGITADRWNKADPVEKRQMIIRVQERLNDAYGLKGGAYVEFRDIEPKDGGLTYGYYSPGRHVVVINDRVVDNGSLNDVMETLTHEMRHVYQHEVVENPDQYVVSKDNAQSWDANFKDYVRGDDYDAYRNQPVETDAWDFEQGIDDPAADQRPNDELNKYTRSDYYDDTSFM